MIENLKLNQTVSGYIACTAGHCTTTVFRQTKTMFLETIAAFPYGIGQAVLILVQHMNGAAKYPTYLWNSPPYLLPHPHPAILQKNI